MELLPEDMLADVLSRLPTRALAVSRGVCRGWRAAADARCGHRLRAAAGLLPVTLGGFFVRTNEPETPAFFARPSTARRVAGDLDCYLAMDPRGGYGYVTPDILDCCNGLLLLDEVDHVVNPATKQWLRLPPLPASSPEQAADGGGGFHHRFLAFDPTLSPHYQVLAMKGPPHCKDLLKDLGLEWPPSEYMMRIYSSSTGKWEARPFVREQGPARTIAEDDVCSGSQPGYCNVAVYMHGALYAYWSNFISRDSITRIALSDDKYRAINLPTRISASNYYQLRLGKSKNGVHFAVVDNQNKLQVWFLDEIGDSKTEWVLKHANNLQAVKFPKNTNRPWILQDGNYDQGNNKKPLLENELDWNSDDDNAVDFEELGENHSCLYIELFGFHPYREIVFLFMRYTVVAYYFNSSKVQNLGKVRIRHRYQIIDWAFTYTPCWMGDLSGNS